MEEDNYKLKYIIFIFAYNTFYKNYMKLNKFNIFESTYNNLSKSKNKIK